MQFRLLGPLEVVDGAGGLVAVAGAKPRAALIVLLLRAGRVVPTEALIAALWDDEPPPGASGTLQSHLSHLRRALGPQGAGLIERHPAGYRLRVEPAQIDAVQFGGEVEAGRAALAAGDAAGAADRLRAALALWRGPALAGVADQPFARGEAARLEELRLGALEARVEADLALGRHAELVGELEALAAEHPLRERLRAQHLLALYRSGRQAEALAAYRDLRERLDDELGIEPSPELQALEQRMLRQDPDLASAAAGARPPAALRPAAGRGSTEPARRAAGLPNQPTPMIGREAELAALRRLLAADVRLVTLVGPGGVGKTRLALAAAEGLLDAFEHGVVFVDLAPLRDPALVLSAVAQALDVRESGARTLAAAVHDALRDRRGLLVLDNFEQVLPAAAEVAALLGACPGVRVVATSREPLRLRWEQEFPVDPFARPDLAATAGPEAAIANPGVALFVARARAVRPDFELTDENAGAVAEICARLDGLPLAIELAAARTRVLPPRALLARVGERLSLLTGGGRDLPARQRTMREAIAWSHDLLQPDDQRALRRLAVFVGGFTFETAEAVCRALGGEADVVDRVTSLAEKSLLRGETRPDGQPRFSMLETVREYALEQLAASGEAAAAGRAHARAFADLAEAVAPHLIGPEQIAWLQRLDEEHDNLRAALDWATAAGEAEVGLEIGSALWRFWARRGHLREGAERLRALLTLPAAAPAAVRAGALSCLGNLAHYLGDYAQAEELGSQSLALFRQLGDRAGEAGALNDLARVARLHGDLAAARRHHEQSLAIHQALGDEAGVAQALLGLGLIAHHEGAHELAGRHYLESLATFRALGDVWSVATALDNLGYVTLEQGDYLAARDLFAECLDLRRGLGGRQGLADVLEGFAAVAAGLGAPESALRLVGAAGAHRERIGAPLSPTDRGRLERLLAPAQSALGASQAEAARAFGAAMTLEAAIAYALDRAAPVGRPPSAAVGPADGRDVLARRA